MKTKNLACGMALTLALALSIALAATPVAKAQTPPSASTTASSFPSCTDSLPSVAARPGGAYRFSAFPNPYPDRFFVSTGDIWDRDGELPEEVVFEAG